VAAFFVEGISAVRDFLEQCPQKVIEVGYRGKAPHELGRFQNKFRAVKELPKGVQSPVFAQVNLEQLDETGFMQRVQKSPPPLLIAVDQLVDPRNLGAIVRSCAFFGVPYVIAPERRQVHLTQASVATAQGGFAFVDLAVVTNLKRSLEQLKELGYWLLAATAEGEDCNKLAGFYDKQVLVIGSEESGISRTLLENCDRQIAIAGAKIRIDSLNASVAAGVLLHVLRQNPGSS
jgi:23S rRNA (guanosine2251-2'-O)-methyltransferase